MSRFGQLDNEVTAGGGVSGPIVSTSGPKSSTVKKVKEMNEDDVAKIVKWLAHASSSSSVTLEDTRSQLRSALLASPLDFLSAHLHELPPTLLALIPLSPAERGTERTIASRRRMYAQRHAPEELSGSGSKERLGGLWARYSEGNSSVRHVEDDRERRVRRRERDEARRNAAKSSGASVSISSTANGGVKGKNREVADFESDAGPTDLVGLAAARHPSLGDYLDGADDPRAAAAESHLPHGSDDGHIIVEEEDEEEEDLDEFEASPADGDKDRAAPSSTGDIAVSAFERHALSLFVAGTDETLPRALYDMVDFDEQWDALDDDANEAPVRQNNNASMDRQARVGSMRGLTSEDAYFDGDDEDE
ncbi:hypothetical protein CF326_g5540 [Tilletia indica]|nr:hypothetical protein CF326_g5540 [Tilletia indica]